MPLKSCPTCKKARAVIDLAATTAVDVHTAFWLYHETAKIETLRTDLARAIEIARDMETELEDVHFRGADNAYCESCGTIYPCNIILKVRAFRAELDAMEKENG